MGDEVVSQKESVIYGLRAVTALAKHRPQDLRRVLYLKQIRKEIGPVLKATAKNRKPYREVEIDDLTRVAGTPHHEGVVAIAQPLLTKAFGTTKKTLKKAKCIIAADGITNPHNMGAILRSMAWFGADAYLTDESRTAVNPAALRVSQGGAEHIPIIRCSTLSGGLRELRELGFDVIAADHRAKDTLTQAAFPKPVCFVLGNENRGISQSVLNECNRTIKIAGPGGVESLNVSVAVGSLLAASGG